MAADPATQARSDDHPVSRTARRKERTRAALIAAAQAILAENVRVEISVKDIADAADVGLGSFYNHFASKDDLFEAAILATLDQHAALVSTVADDLADPAEKFSVGVRLTGRLGRTYPQMARVLIHSGLQYVESPSGLAALALRDLTEGAQAGRLDIPDPALTLAAVGGALLGLLQHLDAHPEVDAAQATDRLAVSLLRMCGLTRRQAQSVVARPLPELPALG